MAFLSRSPLFTWMAALLALLFIVGCARHAPAEPVAPAAPASPPAAAASVAALALPACGSLIRRAVTDKARYAPGEPVTIEVELHNDGSAVCAGEVALTFEHLGQVVADAEVQPLPGLAAGASTVLTFTWMPPPVDYQGYRVEVQVRAGADATPLAVRATAVDVSSDWRKFPRYGFISSFDAAVEAEDVIAGLNAFHINALQFYDWQWQHHRPYSPADEWPDIANRPSSRATLTALIDAAHQRNMIAMSYNLAYGAYDHYWEDGSGAQVEWGLFTSREGSRTPAQQDYLSLPDDWPTTKLYLMNPANVHWQQYLFGQMQLVFDHFAFDGWHIDTLGKRSAIWDADGQTINLPAAYVEFTNAAKAALDKRMVFNTVGGYGQDQVAEGAAVDVVYSEVWESDGVETYHDLVSLVARGRARSGGKAVVLPAYINKAYGQATPADATRFFNEPSVRLADAVIFAAGATHLELGDGGAMLSTEYFPNQRLVMSDALRAAMQDYYDFLVAYENLLLDDLAAADNLVVVEGAPVSSDGKPGSVWTLVRSKPSYTVLHLINLTGNRVSLWRDDSAVYPPPLPLKNLTVKLYGVDGVRADTRLWSATPDGEHGKAQLLPFIAGADEQGRFIVFTVPQLEYWSLVWLEE